MFKISTGLRNYILATGSLSAGLTLGFINIYAGTEPLTADASIGAATLLCTVSVDGGATGLTFEAVPAAGVLSKSTTEAWKGTNAATGTASFYRFVAPGDTGVESTTERRAQGTVGILNADLLLASVSLIISQEQRVDFYAIGMPASA